MEFAPEDTPNHPVVPRLSLKEAAELTGRSVTTLRRYIRAMRLKAEKTPGRFGPEYTLDEASLREAGFEPLPPAPPAALPAPLRAPAAPVSASSPSLPAPAESQALTRPLEKVLQDFVPADLYRELAMKHEQLLVQYGMVRASGQRLFEFREEAESRAEELRLARERHKDTQDRSSREIGFLRQHLRQAELEIEARNQELVSLRDKVRVLELLTRNAVMTESIEQQFLRVFEKEREVESLLVPPPPPLPAGAVPQDPPRDQEERLDLPPAGSDAFALQAESVLPPEAPAPPPGEEAFAAGTSSPSQEPGAERESPKALDDLADLLDPRLGRYPAGRPVDH